MLMMHGLARMMLMMRALSRFLGWPAPRPTELKDAHDAWAAANDAHDARLVLVLGMAASSWPTGLKDAHDARAGANDAHDACLILVLGMAASSSAHRAERCS